MVLGAAVILDSIPPSRECAVTIKESNISWKMFHTVISVEKQDEAVYYFKKTQVWKGNYYYYYYY